MKLTTLLMIFCGALVNNISAQTLQSRQQTQRKQIESDYRHSRITYREYDKLMKENSRIQTDINRAAADGYTDAREQQRLSAKMNKAKDRRGKYKYNRERY